MARPKEFDRDEALEVALKLFWRQGYGATSLHQLLESMQIGRSSFYAAFGDKRALFAEALHLFSARTREILADAWNESASPDVVRQFFRATLIDVPRYRAGRGCMMVNTILELADVDAELSRSASRELAGIEALFEDYFSQLQREGLLSADHHAADMAAHVMLLNQGLRVTSRQRVSRQELERRIDMSLALLGLAEAS
jgi:TetR/AcrR family transcriptional repressor of nem operon